MYYFKLDSHNIKTWPLRIVVSATRMDKVWWNVEACDVEVLGHLLHCFLYRSLFSLLQMGETVAGILLGGLVVWWFGGLFSDTLSI